MKQTTLIPRKTFFGNPDKASVSLSPDGDYIGYLAPLDGVLNVWVGPRSNPADARPITHDTGRGIRMYTFAYTNRHVLYLQDKNGDENWRIYSVDIDSGESRDLTPFEQTQARVLGSSPIHPDIIVAGLNNRNPQWHDVCKVNIVTGETDQIFENNEFVDFLIDYDLRLRLATKSTEDGGLDIYKADADNEWEKWETILGEDALTSDAIGFDKSGDILFLRDSKGRNTAALYARNIDNEQKKLLAEDDRSDAGGVMRHPTDRHIQAVSFVYERKRWEILDDSIRQDLDYLKSVVDGELEVTSRTLDDSFWIVVFTVDNGPVRYYLYDRQSRSTEFLFTNRQDLDGLELAHMRPTVIQSRDGLNLIVYYTLPVGSDSNDDGIPDKPLPAVLVPHGGPWGRDYWGYDSMHQWLANRGYAVVCVNFRSSTGLGKEFINAGNLQWGEKIHEDQIDAVRWAIDVGIANPEKFAVLGGSFGGYSTLAGLTFSPDVFACGVDLVGPSNLITLLESMPPYWKPMIEMFTTRVGDHRTDEGKALLKKHSPLTHVDRICKPLLIGQGANDPRVKQAEADQIVEAMQAKGIPVTYVLYSDEGHGFARPENRLSFFAIADAFLANCLGGRSEPIGDSFSNSSLKVLAGVNDVPGLSEAIG